MTYTLIGSIAVVCVLCLDWWVFRTKLTGRRVFWVAYGIILGFQLAANAVLTGLRIVRYSDAAIVGPATPPDHAPPFIGAGRLAFAPYEDLMFGFSLVLLTLSLWVLWGRLGVQPKPMAGPPRGSGPVRNVE